VSRLKDKNDRRSSVRFQLEREIRYKVGGKRGEESGVGQSINLSSSGVLFTTDRVLISGSRIELSISWPARLNDKVSLKLVARGRLVRFEAGLAAMKIEQYEFHTLAPQSGSAKVN
jgi:hypothetical protein